VRAVGYCAARSFIPLFPVYSLLFADHGLSGGRISSLYAIWSAASFLLEIPSGAWADVVSRRKLLVLSSLLYAAGFATWTIAPSYLGFAAGFVLWAASSALMSGTFQAFLYDELSAIGAQDRYASVSGWCDSWSMMANLTATLLATPLYRLGGYRLLGAVSVGAALAQALVALSQPAPAKTAGHASSLGYMAMLKAGLGEALRVRIIRRGIFIAAIMAGLLIFDEYFGLLANEHGMPTAVIPVLIGITVAAQAIGTALAGRTAGVSGRVMAVVLVVSAILIAAGAAQGRWWGFTAVAIGYGAVSNLIIVVEARVQASIAGPARATVTSVIGLAEEVLALSAFGAIGVGTHWFSISTLVMLLTVPMLAIGLLVAKWLPRARDAEADSPSRVALHDV
jgi:MFS family permease